MSRPDDGARLQHMLDYAREAVDMARGRRREDLDTDRQLNLSLTRLLEVIGEAASRVSKPGREQRPEIPWPDIVGLRNRLIHGDDEVDLDVLWDIVQLDLPALIRNLERMVS